ncbi:hypothetical protein [Nodosilinea nodulosa]|uniref:COG4705 family protein n=1 Tax=Nodosilinea nodulosa TaxID=416001 RepID=UPI0002D69318|nr:hypothetical protein [Nodosilinea nodulosa]
MESTLDTVPKQLVRVPEVTLYFWIIKIMATTVGETAADFLSATLNLGLVITSYIMSGLLIGVLLNQFRLKRYIPANYWLVVVLVSIVGTLITDLLVDNLGVTKLAATIGFSLALAVVFAAWYLSEKTLAMHSIRTAKRELFYWATIFFTFALGTAAGDLLAEASGLGYFQSALVFGAAIALVAAADYFLHMNEILAFWLAYILTRPLGASTGDLLSQPVTNGGLGFGTVGTSMIFLTTILILIVYLSVTRKDQIRVGEELVDN